MVQYCAVPQCKNNALIKGISFHVFPKDTKLRRLWEIKVRRDSRCNAHISSSMRICSEHFLDSDFKKTVNNKNRYLKADAVPSVFPFNRMDEGYPSQDKKFSREREHVTQLFMSQGTSSENHICEEYYLEEGNKTLNSIKLGNTVRIKRQEAQAHSGVHQSNLYSYLSGKVTERKLLTMNLNSNIEKLDPKTLSSGFSDKENSDLNSSQEQTLCTQKNCFAYEKLVENVSLIKKPNLWWTISSTSNFIICARWNSEYVSEKRIVIESTLTVRVFLKEMEINITDFMDISCIDDISNLLEKVENYKDLTENYKS